MKGYIIISISCFTILLILYFSFPVKSVGVIFTEILLGIFGILGLVLHFLLPRLKGEDNEGRWFLNEIKGICKTSKINENYFIPNMRETTKQYRNPIPWTELNFIKIKKKYEPLSPSSDIIQYKHYLKVYLNDGGFPKFIWITSTSKDKDCDDHRVILMKKFCEFLITTNQ